MFRNTHSMLHVIVVGDVPIASELLICRKSGLFGHVGYGVYREVGVAKFVSPVVIRVGDEHWRDLRGWRDGTRTALMLEGGNRRL